jgi:arginine exporter protein ArgO
VSGALVAGLLAGYGVAVPVGAIAVLIIGLTARTSLRVGASAALGVATADGLYALIAVLGGAALADLIEPIATPLRWVAAVVLVVLAIRTAITAVRHHRDSAEDRRAGPGRPAHTEAANGRPDTERGVAAGHSGADARDSRVRKGIEGGLGRPRRAYFGLLGLTLLNPTTIVYFGALVLGRQATDGLTAAGEVVFVAAAFAASASWQLTLAGGGSLIGRLFTGPRGRLATALTSSTVVAILAVNLVA